MFTGALSIGRVEAWDLIAELGAIPEKNVTKRTTVLVVGDGFTGNTIEEFHTGKAADALRRVAKGQPIEVLTEPDLLQLLEDRATSGQWTAKKQATARLATTES